MKEEPLLGFEMRCITLPLSKILPVRSWKNPEKNIVRYKSIVTSIPEVGLIAPLMVYPKKGRDGTYLLMDGHLRYQALKELGIEKAECLVATEDESYTYNARINRLSPVQEHAMIVKAVKNGVPMERIASALNMKISAIRDRMNLVKGIHEDAVEILKNAQVTPGTFRILKRVTALRQIEMAEMMVQMNDFTASYAEGLFLVTHKDQLLHPEKPKSKALSPEEIARMEQEMENVEADFRTIEENYSENMLNLTVIRGYVKKLLENGKVVRFLSSNYQDVFSEFERTVASEGL